MLNKLKVLSVYKVPLLLSLTLAIVLVATRVLTNPFDISAVSLGSILGTFLLDVEYVLLAYLFEPNTEFSTNFKGFIKHADFVGAANYAHTHGNSIKEKSLNSVLFQVVLAISGVIVGFSSAHIVIKAFVLSVFANSIYKFFEHYFENTLEDWFWALKARPSREGVFLYSVGIIGVFVFCLLRSGL